jgi:hypothetical protein
VSGDKGS